MMIRSIISLLINIPTYPARLRRWGVRKFLRISIVGTVIFYILPPILNYAAKLNGPSSGSVIFGLAVLMTVELWSSAAMFCSDIIVTNAAPNRESLGIMNAASEFSALLGVSVGMSATGCLSA